MPIKISPLDNLPANKKAVVVALLSSDNERRRNLDLGIVPGTNIKMLFESPNKNPKAYLIRGTVLALRNEDANKILIKANRDDS
ncbi:MAG: ferrous iron transport protein A [Clostridia bacterium]|nr:ferrous iron transport protein A [Clostridia bacterium]